jgi:hypothetical protein
VFERSVHADGAIPWQILQRGIVLRGVYQRMYLGREIDDEGKKCVESAR